MPQWNFNTPYRLLDGRAACGLQVVVDNVAAVCAAMPAILGRLVQWKKKTTCSIDDCSLELAGCHFQENDRYVLRWGLILRFAAPQSCHASSVSKTAAELKKYLGEFLTEADIAFEDAEDDDAVLAHFPVWDAGAANRIQTGCFAKKGEVVNAAGEPLLWYKELQSDIGMNLASILQIMNRHQDCGLSFEMHALPANVYSYAATVRVQDSACAEWMKKIAERKAIFSRLTFWGNKQFADAANTLIEKSEELEKKKLDYTRKLSYYMVYDPWAYADELVKITASEKMGATRYALTCDEMKLLWKTDAVMAQAPVSEAAWPGMSAASAKTEQTQPGQVAYIDQEALADRVVEKIGERFGEDIKRGAKAAEDAARIGKENKEEISRNTKAVKQNTEEIKKNTEEIRKNTEELTRLAKKISSLSEKVDNAAELASVCEEMVPAGCEIAFTAEELEWLEIEREEELGSKYGMDETTIRLLKTTLTLARLGMQQDEKDAALMAFSAPLGATYEHMMRKYFQPSLYDKACSEKQADKTDQREPNLCDFDYIDKDKRWPCRTYAVHVQIDKEKWSEPYWVVWLNIMKPIREIRNKVHTENGEVTRTELKMMYDVLIRPGMKIKQDMLEYAKSCENLSAKPPKRMLYLYDAKGWQPLSKFIAWMNTKPAWFTPSFLHFILMCREAQWISDTPPKANT